MPRIFIALPVADHVKEALAALSEKSKPKDTNIRWVRPDQFHITLRFLGDVPEEALPKIQAAVSDGAAGTESWQMPFRITAQGLGAFPNPKRSRILWAGLSSTKNKPDALFKLQHRVEKALVYRGFSPADRPFHPHITLARLRSPAPFPSYLKPWMGEIFGYWDVDSVHIIESRLRPTGPQYVIRDEVSVQS